MAVYQKPYDAVQSYTYALRRVEVAGFEIIALTNAGLYTTMIETTSWPGDDIKDALPTANYKNFVVDPGLSGNVAYVTNSEIEYSEYEAGVLITNKDEELRAQFVTNTTILQNYLNNFVTNNGFAFSSEYPADLTEDEFYYAATIKSPDQKFSISVVAIFSSSIQMMQLSYKEYVYGAFPAAQVGGLFYDDSFPTLASANGEYSYKISTSSNSTDISMTALGLTQTEIETYIESLRNYGCSVSNGQSTSYSYYNANFLLVNNDGAFNCNVRIYLYANYATLTFSKTNASTTDFGSAIYKFAPQLRSSFVSALGDDFCDGNFVTDVNNKVIYAMGYSNAEAQYFLSVCTNDPILGFYYFADENNSNYGAVKVSVDVFSNYLAIHVNYINGSLWYHYADGLTSDGNSLIDALFEQAYSSEDPSTYYFGSNSLKFSRQNYSYDIYAFGQTLEADIASYKALLLTNTNIQYSEYMDTYVDTTNGVGITFSMHQPNIRFQRHSRLHQRPIHQLMGKH